MTTRRYALRDDQWARMEPPLPGRVGYVGGTTRDNRLFVEAVLYRYRAGSPWRDVPERFGGRKNTHTRFSRSGRAAAGEAVHGSAAALARALPFARIPDAERSGLGGEQVILQLDELAEVEDIVRRPRREQVAGPQHAHLTTTEDTP